MILSISGNFLLRRRLPPQLLKVMKLTAFLLTVAFLQVHAKGISQVTLSLREAPVEKVFREIERQTGYGFLYTKEMIAGLPQVTISVRNAPVKEVLNECFKGQSLEYYIDENTIVITRKVSPPDARLTTFYVPPPPIEIHGRVVNQQGQPLQNVSVLISGTRIGTTTNIDGNFTINAPDDRNVILEISSVGYQTKKVNVGKQTKINITLELAVTGLSDVVVVGYGTQKKTSLTTAVASISGDELTNQSTSGDLRKTLQGMAPGLTILDNGGQPGDHAIQMQIRGVSSVNGSEPLVVVDGQVASLENIDPNAVESISVLKDAASTAIYGSRGSNGIILITTKKGSKGPIKINYEPAYGLQDPTVLPKFINTEEFLRFRNILAANDKKRNPNSGLPTYTDQEILDYVTNMKKDPVKYPAASYNLKDIYRTAAQTRHSLTLSGGGNFVQTMLNLSYYQQDGLIWERNYERMGLRMNNNFNLSKTLSAHVNLFYQTSTRKTQATGFAEYEALQGLHNQKSKYGLGGGLIYDSAGNYIPKAGRKTNPRLEADTRYMGLRKTVPHYYTVDGGLDWKPVKGLKLSGMYAFQYTDNTENYNIPKWDLGFASYNNNALSYYNQHISHATFNLLANYQKSFNKHNISALAGYATEDYKNDNQQMYGQDFFNNDIRNISAGSQENIAISNGLAEWALQSYFGRAAYNFDEKYYVELSLRSDGSSRFPKENRYSQFPSVSAAWRISHEKFWEGISSVISDFKIRYSYGQTGSNNGVDNYSYIPQLILSQSYGFTTGPGGEYAVNTVIQNTLTSEQLSWEKVTQNNLGIDMGFIENKLTITFDVFNKITNGILLNLPVPGVVGLNSSKTNAGKITNKGWEFTANWKSSIGKLKYSVGVGIASVEDKLTDYAGLGITQINDMYYRWEGSPLFAIRGYKVLGIYQTDEEAKKSANIESWQSQIGAGDYHYEDVNGDGVIDQDNDAQLLGDRTPKYTFNLNLNAAWKGIDISMLWNGAAKVQTILKGTIGEAGAFNNSPVLTYWRNNYWSKEGDVNVYFARPLWGNSNNYANNSRFVHNADYFRLKSLVIGYTLPGTLTKRISLNKVRVFFNATNLLTLSSLMKNWGVDPEDVPVEGAWQGLINGDSNANRHIFPMQLKTFNFGIDIQL
jgi:TonB-linked SusC/RagA family outer membrane protein